METCFAIVGCGYIAERHATHISAHMGAKLHGAFDIEQDKAERFAEKHNVLMFESLEQLVQDPEIDIVTVCTPNDQHPVVAVACLKAGKHVLVEKPMAISVRECEAMLEAAMQAKRELYIVKQNRFNPPVQEVKKLVDQGLLGKLHLVAINCYWNRNNQYYDTSDWKGTLLQDGGTLFTQFSHFIDIMYYLFGGIHSIQGRAVNIGHQQLTEFEDTGCVTFDFGQGGMGSLNFTTTAYEKNMEGSISIFAENASIKIGGKYLNTVDYQCTDGFDIEDLPISNPANNYGFYEGSMSNHDKVIDNVVKSLKGEEPIMTSAREGREVVDIIERINEVIRN